MEHHPCTCLKHNLMHLDWHLRLVCYDSKSSHESPGFNTCLELCSCVPAQNFASDAFTFEAWVSTTDYCHRGAAALPVITTL